MKGTKKLKRILAVMTAAVTMTAMSAVTAMAAPEDDLSNLAPSESDPAPSQPDPAPSDPSYPWGSEERPDPNDPWPPSQPDYPWSPSESEYPPSPSEGGHVTSKTETVTYDPLRIIEEQTEHSYVKGSGVGVTITSNGEYSKFFSVFIDGVFLDRANYIVERGSTVLTIMPEYLDTLPVGAHTVTMNYTYGSVDSMLNIAESNQNVQNMSTDPQNSVSNQANNNAAAGNSNTTAAGNTAAPQTGDTSAILLWSMVVLASGCSCAVLIRRKRISSR